MPPINSPSGLKIGALVAAGFSTGRLISTVVPLAMGAAAQQIGLTAVMAVISVFYLICMVGVLMLKETRGHI